MLLDIRFVSANNVGAPARMRREPRDLIGRLSTLSATLAIILAAISGCASEASAPPERLAREALEARLRDKLFTSRNEGLVKLLSFNKTDGSRNAIGGYVMSYEAQLEFLKAGRVSDVVEGWDLNANISVGEGLRVVGEVLMSEWEKGWRVESLESTGDYLCKSCPTQDDPAKIVRTWNDALYDGRPDLARAHTSALSETSLEQLVLSYQNKPRPVCQDLAQSVNDDVARVTYRCRYADGSSKEYEDTLFRERGRWKLHPGKVRRVR